MASWLPRWTSNARRPPRLGRRSHRTTRSWDALFRGWTFPPRSAAVPPTFKTFASRACCMAVWCARHATVRSSKALTRPPPGRSRELSRSCATGAFSALSPSGKSRRSRRAPLCATARSGQGAPNCPIPIRFMIICSRCAASIRSPASSGRVRRPAARASWRRHTASLISRMPP